MTKTITDNPFERRLLNRVDSTLSLHYQPISSADSLKDPYDSSFSLPRYFTLFAEIEQVNSVQRGQMQLLARENERVHGLMEAVNLKIELLTGAIYDGLAKLLSPIPQQVNLSESGLSFHATEALPPGTHLHLAISHLEHHYHIAATARVVYCEDEDLEGFRTGVYFININPSDRARLAQDIARKQQDHETIRAFANPED
ncbi:PilZ domain-containing protein [Agitococcus lubricus]|uniref:PilZ domain-containing protein n=1 Tax=Agitococcus lubricus TaxID=1077255 RepID=A0A2T5J1P7_9GAMM|nr:PilZ domain-containing protein [Agitococcus lubricus]PTQ90369.1 PilZ domain-containing protein [Agitococcus lubricus]